MMFYETAAQAIGDTVCGRNMLLGPTGRLGSTPDHTSGLESRFMGEIAQLEIGFHENRLVDFRVNEPGGAQVGL